jgi:hypothetical protein
VGQISTGVDSGRYERIIPRWQAAVAPDHLFIGMVEEVTQAPEAFAERLASFLGLDADGFRAERARARVFQRGEQLVVPEEVKAALEAEYAPTKQYLLAQRGGDSVHYRSNQDH